ncbi:MAG TPA: ATP-binding protein [Natronosporangium sp.]
MTSADRSPPRPRPEPIRPPPAELRLRFDIGGLRDLRARVAAHAGQAGASQDQIERLLIVACELATNAIRHGGGTGQLRMWHEDGTITCQVTDKGPGIADPTVGTTKPDLTDTDGHRGLWICRQLSQTVEIHPNPDGPGVTVTAVVAREPVPGPASS